MPPSREKEQGRQRQGVVRSCGVSGKQSGWDVGHVRPSQGEGDTVASEEGPHSEKP